MGRKAQVNQYNIDIATFKTTPDDNFLSLLIAGYAAPRKGRMNPERLKKSEYHALNAITGAGNALNIINKTRNY